MISIVISSCDEKMLSAVSQNIAETIGVPYQLIAVNNSDGKKGICEIYNSGIDEAIYEMICFMHEDVLIKTINWGQKVLDLFAQHQHLGLLGIAGSSYKSFSPSGWNVNGSHEVYYANLIQHYKFSPKPCTHIVFNPQKELSSRVACIDGVWFCVEKKIASQYRFDQDLLRGFHGYDLDFSLNIGQQHEVRVTHEILLEHLSEGRFEKDWLEATVKLHHKWKHMLPVDVEGLTKKNALAIEKSTFRKFLGKALRYKLSVSDVLLMLWEKQVPRKIGWKLFFKLNLNVLSKALKPAYK